MLQPSLPLKSWPKLRPASVDFGLIPGFAAGQSRRDAHKTKTDPALPAERLGVLQERGL